MKIDTKFEMGQEVWINIFDDMGRHTTAKGKITMIRVFRGIDIDYEIKTAERWIIRPECYIYGTEQEALENREKELKEVEHDYNNAKRK